VTVKTEKGIRKGRGGNEVVLGGMAVGRTRDPHERNEKGLEGHCINK
jgi:hypothetical protein